MRTERTGLRRAALIAAALAVVLGAWWLWDDSPSSVEAKAPLVQASAPAAHEVQLPPPAIASVPDLRPEPAAPQSVQAAAVLRPRGPEDAVPAPIGTPAEPQMPSTPTRGEHEPD